MRVPRIGENQPVDQGQRAFEVADCPQRLRPQRKVVQAVGRLGEQPFRFGGEAVPLLQPLQQAGEVRASALEPRGETDGPLEQRAGGDKIATHPLQASQQAHGRHVRRIGEKTLVQGLPLGRRLGEFGHPPSQGRLGGLDLGGRTPVDRRRPGRAGGRRLGEGGSGPPILAGQPQEPGRLSPSRSVGRRLGGDLAQRRHRRAPRAHRRQGQPLFEQPLERRSRRERRRRRLQNAAPPPAKRHP